MNPTNPCPWRRISWSPQLFLLSLQNNKRTLLISMIPIVLRKMLAESEAGRKRERQEKERAEARVDELKEAKETAELEAAFRDEKRHAWQLRQQRHPTFEGIDDYCSLPDAHLEKIRRVVCDQKFVLLRAPPGSGKTSMAEAFQNHCVSLGHPVFHLTLLRFQKNQHLSYDEFFRSYFDQQGGVSLRTSFSAIFTRASQRSDEDLPLVLILDESQRWFGGVMSEFFARVKDGLAHMVCLCFSAFGDSGNTGPTGSPLEIRCHLGFPELQLDLLRLQDVIKKIKNHGDEPFTWDVSDRVMKKILHHSNGHARLIREVLTHFFHRQTPHNTEAKQFKYLHSQRYFNDLLKTRVFANIDTMYDELKTEGVLKSEVLEAILSTSKATKSFIFAKKSQRAILLTYGVFYQDNSEPNQLYLLSPTAYDVLLTHHMEGTFQPADSRDSYENFLETVIGRMSRQRLKGATSENAPFKGATFKLAELSEDFLQKEFYRAALSVLEPGTYTIQTNAGTSVEMNNNGIPYTTEGNLDFYIDSNLQWCIELMFQGSGVAEHVDRFDPLSGIYRDIDTKHKAVVDFRLHDNAIPPRNKRDLHRLVYWAVVYDNDFSVAEVHRSQVYNDTEKRWIARDVKKIECAQLQP